MRSNRLFSAAVLLLCALLSAAHARADEPDEEDEYEEQARVMRVSLMRGEVSLRRAGNAEWEQARLNVPLVEGDTLATAADSRLEIQLDAYNFVRVGQDSVIKVVTLREEGVALSLSEGTATVRLSRFEGEREYFEIDAPQTTVAAERRGVYRLDVSRDGSVRVTVRDDGRARVYSEQSAFTLRDKKTARLYYEGGEGDWEIAAAPAFDGWDLWTDERERFLASRLRYEQRERYYDADVWGAEELDSYGDWSHTPQYGWVWRPHITVVNHYRDWAPYRYGHWRWCPPYGWTWIADEDWGWAPYHYGRWVVHNNTWCWAPRGYGYNYRRARWRPALVAFVYIPTSFGEHVAWYPLGHGQYDPRGRWGHRNHARLSPLRAHEAANLARTNPLFLRAVTSVPAREFGARAARGHAAAGDIARRAVTGQPVRGRLPITPNDIGRDDSPRPNERAGGAGPRAGSPNAGGDRPGVLRINRPAPVGPARAIPDRDTGAAARTPGVPLDESLRRTRIFGGREPRNPSATAGGQGDGDSRGTGVFARPPRVARPRPSDTDAEAGASTPRSTRVPQGAEGRTPSEGASASPSERVRPIRRGRGEDDPAEDGQAERRARPARPFEEGPSQRPEPLERPAPRERTRPSPQERPAPDDNPAPRVRPAPRHEEAPPRVERPAPRQEPPSYSAPPPPAPREQPPPRHEPRPARPEPREERPAAPREERREPQPRTERPARPSVTERKSEGSRKSDEP